MLQVMSGRKAQGKRSAAKRRQNSDSQNEVGGGGKKTKKDTVEATAAHVFNTNVKPVLEADITAIRDAEGPQYGRSLGAQARTILLSVVYILQLAWRGSVTQAVLGAAACLGVSAPRIL